MLLIHDCLFIYCVCVWESSCQGNRAAFLVLEHNSTNTGATTTPIFSWTLYKSKNSRTLFSCADQISKFCLKTKLQLKITPELGFQTTQPSLFLCCYKSASIFHPGTKQLLTLQSMLSASRSPIQAICCFPAPYMLNGTFELSTTLASIHYTPLSLPVSHLLASYYSHHQSFHI